MTILFALLHFYQMVRNVSEVSLYTLPTFWFNTGNLIFYCTTFSFFGLLNPMLIAGQQPDDWQFIMIWGCNLFLYCTYFTALKNYKTERNATQQT